MNTILTASRQVRALFLALLFAMLAVASAQAQRGTPPKPPTKPPQKPTDPILNEAPMKVPAGVDSIVQAIRKMKEDSANPRAAAIVLTTRNYKDSIVLRWGITKPGGWVIANKDGFFVERAELDDSLRIDSTKGFTPITPEPIFPWPLAEWEKRDAATITMRAVAAHALYGESFQPSQQGTVASLRNRADELTNRWSFAHLAADVDPVAAEGLALRIVDRNVKPGQHYLYRVTKAFFDSTYTVASAYMVAAAVDEKPQPAPTNVASQDKQGRVLITWDAQTPNAPPYSAFVVERAEPGSNQFRAVSSEPIVGFQNEGAQDSIPIEMRGKVAFGDSIPMYKQYRYRVRGLTPFGEQTEPSSEVAVMIRDHEVPPPPVVLGAQESGPGELTVTWRAEAIPSDFKGFIIVRSTSYDGQYKPIHTGVLPATVNAFVDKSPRGDTTNFYMVQAWDTAGNFSASVATYGYRVDSIPPAIPAGLKGTIDTNGIVKLSWAKGKERDLLGYRVYRTNSTVKGYEFIQITKEPIAQTTFVDTVVVRTLTTEVFYRVVAVDRNYNNSEFSDQLRLERPDLLPPVAPMFTDVLVADTAVYLSWVPSSSRDVQSHILYRRMAQSRDTTWKQIGKTMGRTDSTFADRDVKKRVVYEYTVVALDSTGFRSPEAVSFTARPYDDGVRPPVTKVAVKGDTAAHTATLTWEYPKPAPGVKMRFIIYRAVGLGPLQQYKAVPGDKRLFVDTATEMGGSHQYAIRALFDDDGAESELSQRAELNMGAPRLR
ncbi:MAG: hypothetical protein IT211_04245 [Armatimonadetes bacterium]|nr:hypothetical protein [Armatimonadota bacterium]